MKPAAALFPADRLPLAERFADLLSSEGVTRGLIGPRETPRLWDRHLANSALLAQACAPDATVADIGSGAGLPGIVLAIARPDLALTLVEPLERRTTFLQEVVDDLGLPNVEVVRGRAEVLHGRRTFSVVTARAVAPLPRLLTWCMPLVSRKGALIALKGASAEDEIERARPVLRKLGCGEPVIEVYTAPDARQDAVAAGGDRIESIRVVRVEWADGRRTGRSRKVALPASELARGRGSGGGRAGRRAARSGTGEAEDGRRIENDDE